ncbi:trimethylamine methyltransferase family protein [Candidatus Bipolaricaulota bacterium]|nr:trimethylamine methyltransferase family protein [Candidatus Bipolaricaulota bacterium]
MTEQEVQVKGVEVSPDNRLDILTESQIEKIHQATLTVLKEAGINFPNEKALNLFAEAGAEVDFDEEIVRIPADLIDKALDRAPRNFTLGSRKSTNLDLTLDGKTTYFRNSGVAPHVLDPETGKRRSSQKSDVELMAKVADSLPMMSHYWPIVSAQDSGPMKELHELEASVLNTEKHVQTESMVDEKLARYTVEIAKVLAGDNKTFKERPPISTLICPIEPLAQDRESLEAALVFAEAGMPTVFDAMPQVFATAPGTLAGALVVGNAELLADVTLMQLKNPGTPVIYFMVPSVMNPETGGYAQGDPLSQIMSSASVELGHYYDLPTCRTTALSDATKPGGWQIGKDAALSSTLAYLSGSDLAGGGLGLLESANLLSPEQIVLDSQILEDLKVISEGIQVDQQSLAVDEIIKVGPRGNYLTQASTAKRVRELWKTDIAHHLSDEEDVTFRDPRQVAVEEVEKIKRDYDPKPPAEEKVKEIRKIIERAEAECS